MKLYFSILIILLHCLCLAEQKTLTISDNLSWKSVFDDGFHPVWRLGGHKKCQESDVELSIKFNDQTLKLDKGDIQFTTHDSEQINLISYYGRAFYTEPEAVKKVGEFKKLFQPFIKPNQEEKIGAWAQVGDYGVYLSFSSSMNDEKPYILRFGIYDRSGKTKPTIGGRLAKDSDTKVKPPEGYKHLSLDPKDKLRGELRQQALEKAGIPPLVREPKPLQSVTSE